MTRFQETEPVSREVKNVAVDIALANVRLRQSKSEYAEEARRLRDPKFKKRKKP